MATDATGTPTSPDSIPKYNTAVDAPSGRGFNAAMDAIQTALSARILKSLVTAAGDLIYATANATVARLGIGSTGQVLTVAGGVPTWATPTAVTTVTGRYKKTAGQTLTSGTPAVLTWDSEDFDASGLHDNVTNNSRLTIGTAGIYLVVAVVHFGTTSSAGYREVSIMKNGAITDTVIVAPSSANDAVVNCVSIHTYSTSDYVEVKATQTSGSPMEAHLSYTRLMIAKVG